MFLLDAVNILLRGAGLDPASDTDTEDEKVNIAIDTIERVRRRILSKGWPFNKRIITLEVNSSDKVPIAKTYLHFELPSTDLVPKVDTADGNIYIWSLSNDDWWDQDVQKVTVIFDEDEIQNIPHRFAEWIAYEAAVDFFGDHHNHQRNVPPDLERKRLEARAVAENSMPRKSIASVTGWGQRLAFRTRG